jgi:N,N'-diacetyllegionaminate synthase
MLKNEKIFLIAEAGINHGGNLSSAIKLVDKAKYCGVDAIKFQTYKTEKRVKRNSKIFNILKQCELSYEDFYKIKNYCDKKKILFFSTPFDVESVNFLKKIKVKLFKIASFDISNYVLVREIIKTKIPTIISTGMASLNEIKKIDKMFKSKNIPHNFLHCISSYPNNEENSYLNNIKFLSEILETKVGLSDHTNDINTAIYSYILGARIFEKHFKLSKNHKCVDGPVSITPDQFLDLRKKLLKMQKILGNAKFGVRDIEKDTSIYKRKTK